MASLPKSTRKRSKLTEFPELDKKGEVTNPRTEKKWTRPETTRAYDDLSEKEKLFVQGLLYVGPPAGIAAKWAAKGLSWAVVNYGKTLGKKIFNSLKGKFKPQVQKVPGKYPKQPKGRQKPETQDMPKPELMHVRPGKTARPITAQGARKLADDAARLRAGTATALGVGVAGAIAVYSALKDRELKGGKKSSYVNKAEKVNEGEERKARKASTILDEKNDDPMMSGKDALGKGKTSTKKTPQTKVTEVDYPGKKAKSLSGTIVSQLTDYKDLDPERYKGKKPTVKGKKPTGEMNAPMAKNNSKIGKGDPSSSPDTSSFRKVSGPDGWEQGKRVYKTPFGNITVDSTDEGMWGKGKTSEDAADLKKGGTAKKKKAVSKYGAKAMKFTNRGGMYKVKR